MRPQQGLPDYLSLKIQTPFPAASHCRGGCTRTAFPSSICTQGRAFKPNGPQTPSKNKRRRLFPAALGSEDVSYQKARWSHTHPTLTPVDISLLGKAAAGSAAGSLVPSPILGHLQGFPAAAELHDPFLR